MSAVEIGRAVKAAREAAGLNQTELARIAGLGHQQTVAKIESGSRKLSWEEGKALQALIGFDTDGELNPLVKDSRVSSDAHTYRRILAVVSAAEGRDFELERVLYG